MTALAAIKRRNWSNLPSLAAPSPPPDAADRLITLLNQDVAEERYERHLFKIINTCLAHGWDADEIVNVFMVWGDATSPPFIAFIRAHRADQLEAYLRWAIQTCIVHQTRRAADADAEAWYLARNWRNARQGAALKLALAGVQLTWQAGSRTFGKDDRSFARVAGVDSVDHSDTQTFRRARGQLGELGALEWRQADESNPLRTNTVYTVHPADRWLEPKGTNPPTNSYLCVVDSSNGGIHSPSLPDLLHPVWDRAGAGLGIHAARVWFVLQVEGPRKAPELAAALNMTPRGVRDVLKRLERYGMVESRNGVWNAVHVDLDLLAIELGVADHRERRALADERQRQLYQAYRLERPDKALAIDQRRAQHREQKALERFVHDHSG
jgi:hypothetical protein